jgi:hypothetical protein
MRKFTWLSLLLLLAASALLRAQTLTQSWTTISPGQCVWHAGDNPLWSAPQLNESGWQPWSTWHIDPQQPHLWIRCRAELFPLLGMSHPVLQVRLADAYQVYVDGISIGETGDLRTGHFSMDAVRSFPLPENYGANAVISLRITQRLFRMVPAAPLPPLALTAGSPILLRDRSIALGLEQGFARLTPAICFTIIGVIGFVLLGLFLYDRTRRELLPLAIVSIALVPLYLNYFLAASLVRYPSYVYLLAWSLPAIFSNAGRVVFFFALAGRRVPWVFRILIAIGVGGYLTAAAGAFLPAATALRLDALRVFSIEPVTAIARIGESLAPFAAFWPWWRLAPRIRGLASLCMAWGATMIIFFSVQLSNLQLPSVPQLRPEWSTAVADAEAVITLLVIVTLLALLFRDQRRTAEERALFAGEMHAAQEIQQMLVLPNIKTIPGLRIDVAFRPMREVGGDFYICRILPGNRQRVILGDVSGKGAAAAMTASVLIGAAGCRDDDSPAELLRHMNLVLCDTRVGGFATCLCADFALAEKERARTMTIATAGHLSPWHREEEVPLAPGLPLGVRLDEEYRESTIPLRPGDIVTFVSDGVVEARNPQGVLFGFDRAELISGESAQAIADAAQRFGQEDDITVLQLRLAITEFQFA